MSGRRVAVASRRPIERALVRLALLDEQPKRDRARVGWRRTEHEALSVVLEFCVRMHQAAALATWVGRGPEACRHLNGDLPSTHFPLETIHGVQQDAKIFGSLIAHESGSGVPLALDGARRDRELQWRELAWLVGCCSVYSAELVHTRAHWWCHRSHAHGTNRLADVKRIAGLQERIPIVVLARSASGGECKQSTNDLQEQHGFAATGHGDG